MRVPLQLKVLAGFALALLPVLGLTAWEFSAEVRQLEQSVLEAQRVTANAVAASVDRQLDSTIGLGWAVSLDPRARSFDPEVLDPYLQKLVSLYPTVTSVAVFDRIGENRGYGSPAYTPGHPRFSIGDRPYFQQVMAANRSAVSNVVTLRAARVEGIVTSVPIRDDEGRPIGVVSVAMAAAGLAKQHRDRSLQSAGQSILLLDREGRLVFHTQFAELNPDDANALRQFPPVVSALAGVSSTSASYGSPLLGDRRLGAFVRTAKYRWVVGVSMPRDVALAPAYARLQGDLVALVAMLLLTMGIALALARYFVRPVRQLEAAARALGRGDLARRVEIRTGDEIEALGASFNEMAARLEERNAALLASQEKVRALNAELEARVRERTEALEAANRELEAFSYSVSHDLRAPLRAVDGFIGATLEDFRSSIPEPAVGFLERAQAGARRMNALIDGLLALSRAARAPLTRIRVDLAAMARDVAAELSAASPVPVEVVVGDLPPANGDPVLLRQVFTNLVGNALKYSRGQPRPRLEIGYTPGPTPAWYVRDNGVGFDMAYADKLFQPFQRLPDAGRFEGSGIGLAIVQRVITRHGGRVWAEARPGEGATFWFTLTPGPEDAPA